MRRGQLHERRSAGGGAGQLAAGESGTLRHRDMQLRLLRGHLRDPDDEQQRAGRAQPVGAGDNLIDPREPVRGPHPVGKRVAAEHG